MIEARVVGPDEWRLWRQLRLRALAHDPGAFGATLAQWSGRGDAEDRWRARLREVPLNLVLFLDTEPAGMASAMAPDDQEQVEVISMWIAPSARGRGLGDEALRLVVAWARSEHPCSGVRLSVKATNAHAIELYERHGFVDAGPSDESPDERRMLRSTSG